MAAREFAVRNNSLQLWTDWAERRDINIDNINLEDDNDMIVTEQIESHAIKLGLQDMKIFGCCPSNDDVYLVICEDCNPRQVIKPQNLKHHYEVRHAGVSLKYWKGKSETTAQYSRTPVTKAAPSQNSRTSTSKSHWRKGSTSKSNNNHSAPPVLTSDPTPSASKSEKIKSVPKAKRNSESSPAIKAGPVAQSGVQITQSPLNTLPVTKELPSPQKPPPPEVPIRTSVICSTEEPNTFSNSPSSVQSTSSVVPQKVTPTNSEESAVSRVEETLPKKAELPTKSKRTQNERKPPPIRDREYDPNIHCCVVMSSSGRLCLSARPCKKHGVPVRRAEVSRTKDFDDLLSDHRTSILKSTKTKPHFKKKVPSVSFSPLVHELYYTSSTAASTVQTPPVQSANSTATSVIAVATSTTDTSSTAIMNNTIALGLPKVDVIGASIQSKLPSVAVPCSEADIPTVPHQPSPNRNHTDVSEVTPCMDAIMNEIPEKSQPVIEVKQEVIPLVLEHETPPQPAIETEEKFQPVVFEKIEKPVEPKFVYCKGKKVDPTYITRSPMPYAVSGFGLKCLDNGPIVAYSQYAKMREAIRIATAKSRSEKSQASVKVPVISRLSPVAVSVENEQQHVIDSEPLIVLPLRKLTASELRIAPVTSPLTIEQDHKRPNLKYSEPSVILPLKQRKTSELQLTPAATKRTTEQPDIRYSKSPIIQSLGQQRSYDRNLSPVTSPVPPKQETEQPNFEYSKPTIISPLEQHMTSELSLTPVTMKRSEPSNISEPTIIFPLAQPTTSKLNFASVSSPVIFKQSEQPPKYSNATIFLPLGQPTMSELNLKLVNKDITRTSNALPSTVCATIASQETQSISRLSVPSPQPKTSKSREKYSSKKSDPPSKRKRTSVHVVSNGTNLSQTTTLPAFPYYIGEIPPAHMNPPVSPAPAPAHMNPAAFPHAYIENSATVLTRHSAAEQNCLPIPLDIIRSPIPQYSSASSSQNSDFVTNLAAINGQISIPVPGSVVHSLTVNNLSVAGSSLGMTLGESGLVRPLSSSACPSPEDLSISTSNNSNKHSIKAILSNSSVHSSTSSSVWSRAKTKSVRPRKSSKTSAITNSTLQNPCLPGLLQMNSSSIANSSAIANSVFQSACDVSSLSNLLHVNTSNLTNPSAMTNIVLQNACDVSLSNLLQVNSSSLTSPNAVNNSLSQNAREMDHRLNVFQGNSSGVTYQSSLHRLQNPIAPSPLIHSGCSSPSMHVSPLHNGLGQSPPPPYYNHRLSISLSPVSPNSTNSRETESSEGSTGSGHKVWQPNSGGISHHLHPPAVYNLNVQRNRRKKK